MRGFGELGDRLRHNLSPLPCHSFENRRTFSHAADVEGHLRVGLREPLRGVNFLCVATPVVQLVLAVLDFLEHQVQPVRIVREMLGVLAGTMLTILALTVLGFAVSGRLFFHIPSGVTLFRTTLLPSQTSSQ